ncbi:catalase family peroxidase [Smaragdicoccus niigatensis]|uniref:catalase family peroxidase n=1 Tax=Smaragdicoccus niigatensis TaxID=359359 RepID=UPI000367DA19|nr:catalase family peroxidase [Smaragdicoccus niigatensis]
MVTPHEAIEAIHGQYGVHPGARALHAKGRLYRGTFTATAEGKRLSTAGFLDGSSIPALVRFSNGAGNPRVKDKSPAPHGLAVKFSLPNGKTADISSQTAKVFITKGPEGLVDFIKAASAGAMAPVKLAKVFIDHPEALKSSVINAPTLRTPKSYGQVRFYGLHAFKWTGADGESRWVRYQWIPEAGEKYFAPHKAARISRDYLLDEVDSRLAQGPIRFTLRVQVAGPDDSTVDPSQNWKSDEFVDVGTLEITGRDTEREKDGDIVVFDPMRVTDGIEPSDDPVLRFRTLAYSESVRLRSGVERGAEAPHV